MIFLKLVEYAKLSINGKINARASGQINLAMALKEPILDKLRYSEAEVAGFLSVSQNTIRRNGNKHILDFNPEKGESVAIKREPLESIISNIRGCVRSNDAYDIFASRMPEVGATVSHSAFLEILKKENLVHFEMGKMRYIKLHKLLRFVDDYKKYLKYKNDSDYVFFTQAAERLDASFARLREKVISGRFPAIIVRRSIFVEKKTIDAILDLRGRSLAVAQAADWLRKNGPKTNQAIAERTEDTGWTCGAVMDNIRKGRIKSEIDPVSGNHLIDKGYLESLVELDNYKTLEKRARMILLWIELSVESRALGHKLGINGDNGKQFFAGIRNKNIDFVSNEETTYLAMKTYLGDSEALSSLIEVFRLPIFGLASRIHDPYNSFHDRVLISKTALWASTKRLWMNDKFERKTNENVKGYIYKSMRVALLREKAAMRMNNTKTTNEFAERDLDILSFKRQNISIQDYEDQLIKEIFGEER